MERIFKEVSSCCAGSVAILRWKDIDTEINRLHMNSSILVNVP